MTEFRNLLSLHPEILLDSSKYGDEEISLIAAAMMKFIETRIIQKQPYEALHHIKETLKVVKKQMMTNTRQPRCTCLTHHVTPHPQPNAVNHV